jgi:hypothetical protein
MTPRLGSTYDLAPDGKRFAVALYADGTSEPKPITHVTLSCLRFSRDGNLIAFIEQPVRGDDGGDIGVLSPDGRRLAAASSPADH